MRTTIVGGALAVVCVPLLASGQSSTWIGEHDVRQRLAAGEVIVRADVAGDTVSGRFDAAIRIRATPEAIWAVLTDCEHASTFVPGLTRCRLLHHPPAAPHALLDH